MALVIDAGALFAQANARDPEHASVRAVLLAEREDIVTTELAVAEADYLILDRLGPEVEAAFLEDLVEGTFVVDCLDRAGLAKARDVVARHRDLQLGLADASLVVVAAEYATRRILTFDERAFRAVSPLTSCRLTLDARQRS